MEHTSSPKPSFIVVVTYADRGTPPLCFQYPSARVAREVFDASVEARGGPKAVASISFFGPEELIEHWVP